MDLESLIQTLTKFSVSYDDIFFQGLKTLKLFTDVKSHVVLLVDHFEILARFIYPGNIEEYAGNFSHPCIRSLVHIPALKISSFPCQLIPATIF